MSGLLLKNVCKTYPGGHQVIRDFNLEVKDGEFLILAGPEGCGKSTLLRMIAGLEDISAGFLMIDGKDMTGVEPRDRNLAMLFRNSVLYPEMNVFENLAFALRLEKTPASEIDRRVSEMAELLALTGILQKLPQELTKEEKLQVLLGRTLIRRPGILLVDSSLAGFDAKTQEQLRRKFLEICKKWHMTVICAMDSREAAVLLDARMIVLNDGAVCQDGMAPALFEKPRNLLVAEYLNYPNLNLLPAMVVSDDKQVGLTVSGGRLFLPDEKGEKLVSKGWIGREVILGIRPSDLRDAEEKRGQINTFSAVFEEAEPFGNENRWLLRFLAEETEGTLLTDQEPHWETGAELTLEADMGRALIFDKETELNMEI